MNYAERILQTLDSHLDTRIELTLYGRAAFLLGFPHSPEQFSLSKDVDAVLWLGQAETLSATSNFWEALEKVNEILAPEGFYMSHLFVEDQVILSPDWKKNRCPIISSYKRIALSRLSDQDLLLSKLMRDDPQDRLDAQFLIDHNSWSHQKLESLIATARIPPIAELHEEFKAASLKLLKAAH